MECPDLNCRRQDWVTISHGLFSIKDAPHFMMNIQLCGRFDIKIFHMELEMGKDSSNIFVGSDAIELSKLWVCFFYETLRSYKAFQKEITNNGSVELKDYWFEEIFKRLSILRMPMAKLQAKNAINYKKGYSVEEPIFFPKMPSIGWVVYTKHGFPHQESRKLLVEEFLTLGKEVLKIS